MMSPQYGITPHLLVPGGWTDETNKGTQGVFCAVEGAGLVYRSGRTPLLRNRGNRSQLQIKVAPLA